MPKILFHSSADPKSLSSLQREFPSYEILTSIKEESDWQEVEIFYGKELSDSDFEQAPHLRWVHAPSYDLDNLPIEKIRERGSVMLSTGFKQNVENVAEFVMGAILSFSKQFFHWPSVPHEPQEFWNWPLKETMWSLRNKTLLQIGLGRVGSEVTRLAKLFEMKTWGVGLEKNFHPYCNKTFSFNNLHSLLPSSDVVVVAFPGQGKGRTLLGKEEMALLKPDSILIVVGTRETIDEKALVEVAKSGRLRGILLDALKKPPLRNSPLWSIPGMILTPNVSTFPEIETDEANFAHFRRNLRSYIKGHILEMKNILQL
ncbi:MAG: putative 2-hydroxyacid dehydrogenase [Chlamydiales bacterium]|nr:putative 2-hydroxyacid dehydrogenase [Chlamydiales bacterium]MCH9635644.1 putative 2-hydroxyacid dehydrogenase [Chlamydiales bacterium]MCH9703348.1 hypothetical protein [Chlamydiota bacterium]